MQYIIAALHDSRKLSLEGIWSIPGDPIIRLRSRIRQILAPEVTANISIREWEYLCSYFYDEWQACQR